MTFATPSLAFVRPPGGAYASCLREHPVAIDVALAWRQHAGYVEALREAGVRVEVLPELPGAPDAMFVEDTAVVLDTCALITHPGAPSRRTEVASIARVLAEHRTLHTMMPPATLDGGDVLRVGRRLLVGLSQRTNRAGLGYLAAVAATDGIEIVAVTVAGGLHLKSACSLAGPETLLVREGRLDRAAIAGLAIECVEVPEDAGANVLAFADRVLVSAAAPRTAALLDARGLRPLSIELSQIHAGDGALSCLSLRLAEHARLGAWVV
jgi:dimethylargininase